MRKLLNSHIKHRGYRTEDITKLAHEDFEHDNTFFNYPAHKKKERYHYQIHRDQKMDVTQCPRAEERTG